MDIRAIIIIVNSSFLLIALIAAALLLRFGALWTWNYGIDTVQSRLKWKILWAVLILIMVGLLAAVFNVVVTMLN